MEGLPTEVLADCIFSHLSLPDICKCRLVSRRLNEVGRSKLGRRWPLAQVHSVEVGLKFLNLFRHCSYRWELDLKPLKLSLDTFRGMAAVCGPTVREYRLRFDQTPSHLPLFVPVQRRILSMLLEDSAAPRLETLVIWSHELYSQVSENHVGVLFNLPSLRTLKLWLPTEAQGEHWMNHSVGNDFLAVNLLRGAPKLQHLGFFETPGWNADGKVLECLQELELGNGLTLSYIPNVYAQIPRAILPFSGCLKHLRLNLRPIVVSRPETRSGPKVPGQDALASVLTPMETFQFLETTAPKLTFLQFRIEGSQRAHFQFPVFPHLDTLILDEADNFRNYSVVTAANFPQLRKLMFNSNVVGISDMFQGSFPSLREIYLADEEEDLRWTGFGEVASQQISVLKLLSASFPNVRKLHMHGCTEAIYILDFCCWLQKLGHLRLGFEDFRPDPVEMVGTKQLWKGIGMRRLESLEIGTHCSFDTLARILSCTKNGNYPSLKNIKFWTKSKIPFSWILVQLLRCTHSNATVTVITDTKDDPSTSIRDNMLTEFSTQ